MKVLAFKVEGCLYCCRCTEDLAHASGYPHLFFVTNKPSIVDGDVPCGRCGHQYGSHDAQMAADRLVKLIRPKQEADHE